MSAPHSPSFGDAMKAEEMLLELRVCVVCTTLDRRETG